MYTHKRTIPQNNESSVVFTIESILKQCLISNNIKTDTLGFPNHFRSSWGQGCWFSFFNPLVYGKVALLQVAEVCLCPSLHHDSGVEEGPLFHHIQHI